MSHRNLSNVLARTSLTGATAMFALASATFAQGVTTIVTANAQGVLGDQPSKEFTISADGRYIAFMSSASNLSPAHPFVNGKIFVRDRVTGALEVEDVNVSGNQSFGLAEHPVISADGRFAAFDSDANDIGGFGDSTRDVFVRDRVTGAMECVTSTPSQPGLTAVEPSLSGDGRYVAYTGRFEVSPGSPALEIYVFDRITNTRLMASVDTNGQPASSDCTGARISRDGRFVAFMSSGANNLVPNDTNTNGRDIFVRDLVLGVTTLVDVSSSGVQANADAYLASISSDGRFIAFSTIAASMSPIVGAGELPYVRDTLLGVTTIAPFSVTDALYPHNARATAMTGDGRYVLCQSNLSDPILNDTFIINAVYVWDRQSGDIRNVSLGNDSAPFAFGTAFNGVCSDDAHTIAFEFYTPVNITQIAVHDRTISFATTFCAGVANCPCGNNGSNGHGCENSFGTGGALLAASGNASVSTDEFVLQASDMPPSTAVLFFQGTIKLNNGAGNVFGDGLVCVGGSVIRLGTKSASGGAAAYGGPNGDTPISVRGAIATGGVARFYQAWYRNVDATYCSPSRFNLTNGVEMHWAF